MISRDWSPNPIANSANFQNLLSGLTWGVKHEVCGLIKGRVHRKNQKEIRNFYKSSGIIDQFQSNSIKFHLIDKQHIQLSRF